MPPSVKHFLSTLQHALGEERHFALLEGVPNPTKTPLPISCKFGTRSDSCIWRGFERQTVLINL
jgi:hypothetical protein